MADAHNRKHSAPMKIPAIDQDIKVMELVELCKHMVRVLPVIDENYIFVSLSLARMASIRLLQSATAQVHGTPA